MRIISGDARGRTLVAPAGQKTRPTQDYVRESLFNILQFQVNGASVLDLFAGTGALALESISRGAASAVLVDSDRAACEAIRKNIRSVQCADRCRLIQRDYRQALMEIAEKDEKFSLVFLDPPYRMTETGDMCRELALRGLLKHGALILVEHRKGFPPQTEGPFELEQVRKYGDTEISFVRYTGNEEEK